MDRKKFMVIVMSVTLFNVSVYGAEVSDFSAGERQVKYQAEENENEQENQQKQQMKEDSDITVFQDETETPSDLTEFTDETPEISDGLGIIEQSGVMAASLADGDNIDENGFVYEYLPESDTYCLVKGADIENVVIPYQYNGKFVSEIGEKAFYGCLHINTVKMEYNEERSGKYIRIRKAAFENCANLREIDLRWAILESRAFYNCPKLWAYYGAGSENCYDTEIQKDSFDPDTKMIFRNIYDLPDSVNQFAEKYRVFVELVENPTEVFEGNGFISYEFEYNQYICTDCTDTVENINLENVAVIGRKAFYGCSNVRKLLISDVTNKIESKAFAKCKNMSIIMPASVTSISEDAFEGASGITIYADKGSYAEKYAKKHRLNCKRTPVATAIPVPKLKVIYTSQYGAATLSWTPVEYANQYYLYKYNEATKKYKRIAWINQNTTSYKIEGPVGKTDKYRVCAMSRASVYTSEYSKKSNTVEVQGRPKGSWFISKKKKGKNFTFKWKKTDGAQGYILYRYDEKAREYKKIKTIKDGNVTTYTDRTGKLDKSISYRIRTYCITKDGTILYGF